MEPKDLLVFAVIIVTVVIAVSLGATVLKTIQDDQEESATGSVVNETATVILNTAVALDQDAWTGAPVVFYNDSVIVLISNYSYSNTSGTITLLDHQHNNSVFNVSYGYTYEVYPQDYNTTGYGLDSLATFGKWMPTIALVIIIAVILGVIMTYLARQYL